LDQTPKEPASIWKKISSEIERRSREQERETEIGRERDREERERQSKDRERKREIGRERRERGRTKTERERERQNKDLLVDEEVELDSLIHFVLYDLIKSSGRERWPCQDQLQ
jgi:hypothetical protein